MGKCEVCGNDYDKAFTATKDGRSRTFNTFECTIQALTPSCSHCGCKVVGHGVEKGGAARSTAAPTAPSGQASSGSKTGFEKSGRDR
jgi:hypothetical protein